MHLLVLSAFRPRAKARRVSGLPVSMHLLVLSAFRRVNVNMDVNLLASQCTFWCSVLSDWRRLLRMNRNSAVSMHLLVLSAFRPRPRAVCRSSRCRSQCTFWCSVLSDWTRSRSSPWRRSRVSMHLLVLSAFRPRPRAVCRSSRCRSQCTFWCSVLSDSVYEDLSVDCSTGLNAPFGAQCFPTGERRPRRPSRL